MNVCLALMLTILFLSGCATTPHINDSDSSADKLQSKIAEEQAGQEGNEEVLAVVNGHEITIGDYNNRLKRLSAYEKARYRGEEGHKEFLKTLIRQKVMVQKAREMELDKDEEVQRKISVLLQDVTERVLIEALIKQEILDKVTVTDKEAKAYYDEHKEEFRKKETIGIRQIIVATEEEAKEIRQELEKGADFAKLANEKSIDQSMANQGNTISYFERGKMPGQFEEACFILKAGEISDPVKTRFGYHVIKLENRQEASLKEFYEVSDEIKEKLLAGKQRKEHQEWLQQLEMKAKIEMKSGFGEVQAESP